MSISVDDNYRKRRIRNYKYVIILIPIVKNHKAFKLYGYDQFAFNIATRDSVGVYEHPKPLVYDDRSRNTINMILTRIVTDIP